MRTVKRRPGHKAIEQRAADAAGFLQGMLDWDGVVIELGYDRWGGFRIERIWSPLSKHSDMLGYRRSDTDARPLAIILAVEEYVITYGSKEAKDRIVKLFLEEA